MDDLTSPAVPVGYSSYYIRKNQNPSVWEYTSEIVEPQTIIEKENGTLYDFGRELTAVVLPVYLNRFHPYLLAYGESEAEALDYENCYYSEKIESENQSIPKHAFRYLFLVNVKVADVQLTARHEFVDIPVRASFSCEDEQLNRIWQVCCETYRLCSGIFFLDGVKRDRWIWSGDAYQSYLINPYLFFDNEITKRTIWGLRGNDPVRQQINTILDYSMYWIMSIENYYKKRMKSYWGAILDEGAAAIWEIYDPNETGKEKYAMYDDPYGKSLCHAWGASPIYLLGRYFLGVESTDTGYKTFRVSPDTKLLGTFDCVVPVAQGAVHLCFDGQILSVSADCDGGILIYGGEEHKLIAGETVKVGKNN